MRLTKQITCVQLITFLLLVIYFTSTTQAKSVYVIIDRHSTVRAYKISGEKIEGQTDVDNLADQVRRS